MSGFEQDRSLADSALPVRVLQVLRLLAESAAGQRGDPGADELRALHLVAVGGRTAAADRRGRVLRVRRGEGGVRAERAEKRACVCEGETIGTGGGG